MADVAASVLAKLKNKAKAAGISYQQCLQLFVQEEFLRKLSKSGYDDTLILKGGLFIYTLTNFESRATIDVDFLLVGYKNSIDTVKDLIYKIIDTPTGNDYITMTAQCFEEISPQRKYHGISTQIIAQIKNVRVPFNIDIGVGDVIVPKPEHRKINTQLPDFETPIIRTYSLESTIAEKFDAILQRFELTSRMKDFYDIYYLSRTFNFEGAKLQAAIFETLQRRGTPFDVSCKDLAGNDNNTVTYKDGTVAANDFIVDKASAIDLEITYNPTFVGTVLDALTFGFYKAPVEVTIEADDAVSGVDYFVYSYTVQTGASSINTGASNVTVAATRDGDTDRYYATFTIPAQFRGFVSFNAFDKAGNEAGKADTNAVVVDTIAPGITVQYNNNTFENNNYFKADRTATITINEANFFQKDLDDGLLVITVGKRLNNESAFTYTDVKPTFAKNGDVYTATVDFNENADYTFDIKYTDRAGNVYDSYTMDEFTVDKIQPELSIGYDNNSAKNGTFYKADREATITVTEHNFRASDVEFTISATDVTETQNITLTDYAAYLKNQANWTQVGDVYTAKIMIDVEGNYTLGMTYSDLAGNAQVSAISDAFCLDKSDSENLKITYNPTFIGTVLETLTFGFYKAPVEVIIEATDDYAGVDYFVYSYTVQTGASSTNTGVSNVQVAAIRDGSTNRYYTTFSIPAQFRGNVSFTTFDKAGNDTFLADEKVVVVDNVAPGVNVVYDNNSAKYDKYYDADRTATITITEANFFQKDLDDEFLVITVEKTLNDGTYTSTKMKPTFVKNGDVYTATIDFTEDADYTFDIKYTDRSGNVYDNYDKDEFTIDKIKPVINVAYDNNTCKNGNVFEINEALFAFDQSLLG